MSSDSNYITANGKNDKPPVMDNRLLNPVDRISEIIFGLIMALTFTCTISIAQADRAEIREMLIGAIGCNIAWGLVDAVMFILTGLTEKGHGRIILNYIRGTKNDENAREFISDALPSVVSSVIENDTLENIRKSLLAIPESQLKIKVTWKDIKTAIGIFLLVFISTFPVAIPFAVIDNAQKALRVSNLIAILLMFVGGWMLARYGGYNKLVMGLAMTLLGIILVSITIVLGG